jgi:predicted O-methyltransferase YrrM
MKGYETDYKNSYTFTMDFNRQLGSIVNISHIVKEYGIPNKICEIGIYEGSTTFWIADNLTPHNENLKIYAIDSHDISVDLTVDLKQIKKHFEYNMALNSYDNIVYMNKKSEEALIYLINDNIKFDFIYIDGDHRASGVLVDLVLAWKILNINGVILCDDTTTWKYVDKNNTTSCQMSPRLAVESFIQCNWHKLNTIKLVDGSQTAFIKLEE